MLTKRALLLLLIILGLGISSCQSSLTQAKFVTESKHSSVRAKHILEENQEVKPESTQIVPTSTSVQIQVIATVFQEIPEVPILMYHRFNPSANGRSEQYKVTLSDLDDHLNNLYTAGYSLVPLEDWLRGEITLPEGRKPLIITIDDLFYADQISMDAEGSPASYSGIGRIWQFYQEHPDFNFHLALL